MADYRKLFFAVLAVGIAVRLFVAVALPDAFLSDSLHHLAISQHIVETGFFPFNGIEFFRISDMPEPLFHCFLAVSSILTNFSLNAIQAVQFPLFLSIVQALALFIVLKRVFPKNWVVGMAFFAILPLLTKYSAVNYVETIASITVLAAFYFFVRFSQTGNNKFVLLGIFSLAAMSVSKLNATILLPAFLLFFSFEMYRKKAAKKHIALFVLFSLALFFLWLMATHANTGNPVSNQDAVSDLASSPARIISSLGLNSFASFIWEFNKSFWAFPSAFALSSQSVSKILPLLSFFSADTIILVLSAITLPFLFFIAFSVFHSALRKKPYALILLSVFALAFIPLVVRAGELVYARLLFPVIPLLSIGFVQGFEAISKKQKKIIVALFLAVSIYSLLSVSFTAVYYNSAFQKSLPLYEEIASLPDSSKVIISGNHFRAVRWFSQRECLGPEEAFGIPRKTEPSMALKGLSGQEIYEKLVEINVTHLAVTCVDDPWDIEVIEQMNSRGMLQQIFSKDCAKLYEVK